MKGKFPAAVVIPYKNEIFSKICKKSTRFVGSISERTFAVPMSPGKSQTEIKNFPSSLWLKIPRRNGRALNHLHVPWQVHIHSSDTFSPTRARSPVRHDHFMRATTTDLKCRTATDKATTAGAGQWYFSKELGGSAGVELPWIRFAVGRQMNPKRTGARSNRCAKN